MKIALIGLLNNNHGDGAILESARYLFQSIMNDNDLVTTNSLIPDNHINFLAKASRRFRHLPKFIKRYFVFRAWKGALKKRNFYEHYKSLVIDADVVVLAGGGLIKYRYEWLWAAIYALQIVCTENKTPLYMNAVGVEGYDKNNLYCRVLQKSLQNIAKISVRDDLWVLQEKYKFPRDKSCIVGDPALFYADANPKITHNKKSDIIGIGIVRKRIFKDNGIKISGTDTIKIYSDLIRCMIARGYKITLFTNGSISDYETAKEIKKNCGFDICILNRPESPQQLLSDIAGFRGIIAGRMHANILATSLGVPSVGLVWNNKLKFFFDLLGRQSFAITPHKLFDSEFIVDRLEESLATKYNTNKINSLRAREYDFIKSIVNNP
ncbi:MAG: polysaccharide pyruvyl transferase family protein [Rickettsiales bacterium]|jgi:polysaccharide pyruvyl transferase WcaK-like protein|nr:polysaccharide pyruvyl transferase family protein [Rickettsiales bacterium]